LDGGHRYRNDVVGHFEFNPNIDELPGPKDFFVVGERRLEGDGAGRSVDLVVDDGKRAGGEIAAIGILRIGGSETAGKEKLTKIGCS
jgi:hypothetical protein